MSTRDYSLLVLQPLLSLAVLLAFVRLALGPRLPDRVVALDLLSMVGIGILAVHTVVAGQPVFIDVAFVLALVSFLATVAFAFYLRRKS